MHDCILHRNTHKLIGPQVPHTLNSDLSVPPSSIPPMLDYTSLNLYIYILRSLNARKAIGVRGISSTGPKRAGHQESHSEDDSTHTHECKSVKY
jgi:hypothetical protein